MGFDVSNFDWSSLPGYGTDPGQPPLSSSPFGPSFMPTSTGVPSGTDYGSLISKMMQGTSNPTAPKGSTLADLSSVLGGFSSGEKANRILQGQLTQGYDQNMLAAQTGRNATESDALKKLAQTSYIMGGGSKAPAPLTINGKTYEHQEQGFGPRQSTDAEKAGAATLQGQLQARLSPGGTYTPQPLDDYAKPGLAENLSSYGGAVLGGLGALGAGGGGSDIANKIAGTASTALGAGKLVSGLMGKEGTTAASTSGSGAGSGIAGFLSSPAGRVAGNLPGAVMGTYGVIKNQSVGSDTLNGMGAGASIGTMVMPGVGTAVGAGVGALVGALRGAFSVTGKEHQGRDTQAAITQNLTKLATPAQQAEAAKAGWPDPNQALSLIIMRDGLIQSGMPGPQAGAQAEAIMHGMWDAEKKGGNAVSQAFSPIQSMMSTINPTSSAVPGSLITDAFSKGAH